MLILGLLLLLAVGGLYAYGLYERYIFEIELARSTSASPTLIPTTMAGVGEPSPPPAAATATAEPTVESKPSPALQMVIPSIGIDSPVVEARIKDGNWEVPKFVIGHLEGTAQPNEIGNAVYSGHVDSISSGNVFANLDKAKISDSIFLITAAGKLEYRVIETKVVRNTDVQVVQPTPEPRITLITCTGTWDIATRDYSHRLVVVAIPRKTVPPTPTVS